MCAKWEWFWGCSRGHYWTNVKIIPLSIIWIRLRWKPYWNYRVCQETATEIANRQCCLRQKGLGRNRDFHRRWVSELLVKQCIRKNGIEELLFHGKYSSSSDRQLSWILKSRRTNGKELYEFYIWIIYLKSLLRTRVGRACATDGLRYNTRSYGIRKKVTACFPMTSMHILWHTCSCIHM